MRMSTVIKIKKIVRSTKGNNNVFQQEVDDNDGAHLTSLGIEFLTEEAEKNKRSQSVALQPCLSTVLCPPPTKLKCQQKLKDIYVIVNMS